MVSAERGDLIDIILQIYTISKILKWFMGAFYKCTFSVGK
jgi:hypothetical protein